MTTLQLLVLGHVLGAAILVGGAFMLQVLAVLAASSPTPEGLVTLARQAAWIGPRVFLPAGALIAVTGAGLVSEMGYSLDEPFLLVGLAVILATAVTGPAFLAPASARLSHLMAADASSPEVRVRVRRLFLVTRVELVLLVAALAAMVVRPTF